MAIISKINERLEEYAKKILERQLYFFLDSERHFQNMFRPLLWKKIDNASKIAVEDSGLDVSCLMYSENYFKNHQNFLVLKVMRDYIGCNTVLTLPERRKKVEKNLQKRGYKIIG